VPQVILKVFIIMLYENVFQNPEFFPTQVSLYPEHSTLILDKARKIQNSSGSIGAGIHKSLAVIARVAGW
jgi:hypothetical protein